MMSGWRPAGSLPAASACVNTGERGTDYMKLSDWRVLPEILPLMLSGLRVTVTITFFLC